WGSFIVGALVGLACGLGNGLLITIGRVNAFIATLATSIIIYGIGQVVTGGNLVSVQAERFSVLGLGTSLGINNPGYVWLAFSLFCGFLLSMTAFGRYAYAVGGNAEAARLSGVRVNVVRLATFAISGLGAGIAGAILFSEVSTAQWNANSGIEFTAITATVLGGTSPLGGAGAAWRAALGAASLNMIGNCTHAPATSPQRPDAAVTVRPAGSDRRRCGATGCVVAAKGRVIAPGRRGPGWGPCGRAVPFALSDRPGRERPERIRPLGMECRAHRRGAEGLGA